MILTEATLSIGMAAAWHTEPVAACLLSGTLVAAGAGLHYAHLLEEASTDRRTGLLRPDSWTKTVARLVSREPVGVILADLDHFKQVNDELGHLAGDEVLTAIGATIAESLRPGDVAGRWGGEEFVVALPGLGPREAREVAERLADAVRSASHAGRRPGDHLHHLGRGRARAAVRTGRLGDRRAAGPARGRHGDVRREARRPRPGADLHRPDQPRPRRHQPAGRRAEAPARRWTPDRRWTRRCPASSTWPISRRADLPAPAAESKSGNTQR